VGRVLVDSVKRKQKLFSRRIRGMSLSYTDCNEIFFQSIEVLESLALKDIMTSRGEERQPIQNDKQRTSKEQKKEKDA